MQICKAPCYHGVRSKDCCIVIACFTSQHKELWIISCRSLVLNDYNVTETTLHYDRITWVVKVFQNSFEDSIVTFCATECIIRESDKPTLTAFCNLVTIGVSPL